MLTTTGRLGDATAFSWTSSCGATASNSHIEGAASRTDNSNYYQQNCGSAPKHLWIQVELPSAVACTQTALIGWSSSHSPNNNAYVKASNDGTAWTEVARWSQHPGGPSGSDQAYLRSTWGSYSGGPLDAAMDTYGISLSGSGTTYKYWRTGGDAGFNNGWMIVQRWVLMCA